MDQAEAARQWEGLRARLRELVAVELVGPATGLPDMVFTANGGLVLEKKAVLSRFLYRERQDESGHFREWFEVTVERIALAQSSIITGLTAAGGKNQLPLRKFSFHRE